LDIGISILEFIAMFWVDQIVEAVLRLNPKDHYVVTDWKTPSGRIHVGSLRGVLIHGVMAKGLADQDKSVFWQYGFDDFDPMDSLPVYLPKSFAEFMGKPLALVPSPEAGYQSFGEFYARDFQNVFESLGEKPKVVYSYALYKQGVFNEAITTVLNNAAKIRSIYLEITHKKQPDDWLPIQMICEQCGRIGTTRACGWDGQTVEYSCEKGWVKYVQGCGFQGKHSPFDGNAKLPWRVEWPAKWFIFQSDVEGAGKDHQTKGGSHDMAVAIMEQVFHSQCPYNIPYEFFLVGGKKMSSSRGLGSSAQEVAGALPSELLRLLMVSTRPNRAINFSPAGDTIPRLYDEYDRISEAYRANPQDNAARQYYYSVVREVEPIDFHYRFVKVAYLIQMTHIDIYDMAEKEKGQPLTADERQELASRIEYAKKWLATYAPEGFKIEVRSEIPLEVENLSTKQKKFLHMLATILKTGDFEEGHIIHKKIHDLKQDMGLQPNEAFQAIYLAIYGKSSGPQAGWLLKALGYDFVIKRFMSI
jgi:lysyl-tRNA synthetase class 1